MSADNLEETAPEPSWLDNISKAISKDRMFAGFYNGDIDPEEMAQNFQKTYAEREKLYEEKQQKQAEAAAVAAEEPPILPSSFLPAPGILGASSPRLEDFLAKNNKEEAEKGMSFQDRLKAGATGLAHGFTTYGPEQGWRALRTIGELYQSDSLQQLASHGIELEKLAQEKDPFYAISKDWKEDPWARDLYSAGQSMAVSLESAGLSALLPGGGIAKLASASLGGGAIAGFAEYDRYMEEAYSQLKELNPNLTKQDLKDKVFWNAVLSGLAEGGFEAVGDYGVGKLVHLFGKAGVEPARGIISKLYRNVTRGMIAEGGTEFATAAAQDILRKDAGMINKGAVTAGMAALRPAMLAGGVFGGAATGLNQATDTLGLNPVDPKAAEAAIQQQTEALQQKLHQNNYSPKAVEAFDNAKKSGLNYSDSAVFMKAVEESAQGWARRNNLSATEWSGDSGKLAESLQRLIDRNAHPDLALPESLSGIQDYLLSGLSPEQQQSLVAAFPQVDPTTGEAGNQQIDPALFEDNFKKLLNDPAHLENIPEAARPAMAEMQEGFLDMYDFTRKLGWNEGFDPVLADGARNALNRRNSRAPVSPAGIKYDEAQMDRVLAEFGDYLDVPADKRDAFLSEAVKASGLDIASMALPDDNKALLAMVDREWRPFIDKMLGRGKRGVKEQEALATARLKEYGIDMGRYEKFVGDIMGNGNFQDSISGKAIEMAMVEHMLLSKSVEDGMKARISQDPADIVDWYGTLHTHAKFEALTMGARSESGHFLSAWKHFKNMQTEKTEELMALMDSMGGQQSAMLKLVALENAPTQAERTKILRESAYTITLDAFMENRVLGLLSSPKTQIANIVGNSSAAVSEIISRFYTEFGIKDGVQPGSAMAYLSGHINGFTQLWKQFRTHLDKQGGVAKAVINNREMWHADNAASPLHDAQLYERAISKEKAQKLFDMGKERLGLSSEHDILTDGLSRVIGDIGRIIGIPADGLLAADQVFKAVTAHGELNALNHSAAMEQSGGDQVKYRELMAQYAAKPPVEHIAKAQEHAKLMTFQQDLSGQLKAADEARKKIPVLGIFAPFVKTPVNTVRYAAAHTPGLEMISKDIKKQLNSPDPAVRNKAESRLAVGGMFWLTSMSLAAAGILTGAGPADKKEREALMATGWRPYSLRIGDTYYSLDRFAPFGTIANVAASLVELAEDADTENLYELFSAGLGVAFDAVKEQASFQGVRDLIEVIDEPRGKRAAHIGRSLAVTAIPGSALLRNLRQQVDPYNREVNSLADAIKNVIPGWSEELPIRRDGLGRPRENPDYWGLDFLSPIKTSTIKGDSISEETLRLKQAGFTTRRKPSPWVQTRTGKMKMSAKQMDAFLEQSGQTLIRNGMNQEEALTKLITSEEYKKLEPPDQLKKYNGIVDEYRQALRDTIGYDDNWLREAEEHEARKDGRIIPSKAEKAAAAEMKAALKAQAIPGLPSEPPPKKSHHRKKTPEEQAAADRRKAERAEAAARRKAEREAKPKRGRGRPQGSKNKKTLEAEERAKREAEANAAAMARVNAKHANKSK